MKSLKTNGKILIILSGVLIFGFLAFIHSQKAAYLKKQVAIELTVMLDNQTISLENLEATCKFKDKVFDVRSENGVYTTTGGEYGEYKFSLVIPSQTLGQNKNNLTFNLNYLNANDWYSSNSKCTLYLFTDKNQNIIAQKAEISVKYNDNTTQKYETDIFITNDTLEVNWGI